MCAKKKVMNSAAGIPTGIGIGVLSSVLFTIGIAALTAWLLITERIGENGVKYLVMLTVLGSVLLGAFISTHLVKRLRLQISLLTGTCYYFILLGTNALFFDGRYEGMLLTAVLVLISSDLIAFFPASGKKIGKWKKNVYR